MQGQHPYRLLANSRFYILAFSVLLSVAVAAWLRLQIPADQPFYIRTQQAFGLLCVLYWYAALVVSPIGHLIGKQRMKHIEFARRAIGVSACYFALLHGTVALWGQLGGPGQLAYLPSLFKWSLLAGAVALLVLLMMAATSFDRVVRAMTFRRWKLLHRLVYIGGILAVLHIWSVGTHLAYTSAQLAAFLALSLLAALEVFRITKTLNQKYLHFDRLQAVTLGLVLWVAATALIFMIPALVQNFHGRHSSHTQGAYRSEGEL